MDTLGVVAAVLILVFLLWGEPDAWDALHAKAMGTAVECPKPKPVDPKKPTKGLSF